MALNLVTLLVLRVRRAKGLAPHAARDKTLLSRGLSISQCLWTLDFLCHKWCYRSTSTVALRVDAYGPTEKSVVRSG